MPVTYHAMTTHNHTILDRLPPGSTRTVPSAVHQDGGVKYATGASLKMDRPGVWQVPEGSGEEGKMEKTGCKIICGAPTTLAVKGLMMMMMMTQHTLTSSPNPTHTHCIKKILIQTITYIDFNIAYIHCK